MHSRNNQIRGSLLNLSQEETFNYVKANQFFHLNGDSLGKLRHRFDKDSYIDNFSNFCTLNVNKHKETFEKKQQFQPNKESIVYHFNIRN